MTTTNKDAEALLARLDDPLGHRDEPLWAQAAVLIREQQTRIAELERLEGALDRAITRTHIAEARATSLEQQREASIWPQPREAEDRATAAEAERGRLRTLLLLARYVFAIDVGPKYRNAALVDAIDEALAAKDPNS